MKKIIAAIIAVVVFASASADVYVFRTNEHPTLLQLDFETQEITVTKAGETPTIYAPPTRRLSKDGEDFEVYWRSPLGYTPSTRIIASITSGAGYLKMRVREESTGEFTEEMYSPIYLAEDEPQTATREELQAMGGIWRVNEELTLTIPWEELEPGEEVSVVTEGSAPQIDGLSPVSPQYRVSGNVSYIHVQTTTGNVILSRKAEGLPRVEGDGWPFRMHEGTEAALEGEDGTSLGQWLFTFFLGSYCDSTHYQGTVLARVYQRTPCDGPVRPEIVDLVQGIHAARQVLGGEFDFPLQPVSYVRGLVGDDAPETCSSSDGVIFCNQVWLEAQTPGERASVGVHEEFHAITFYMMGDRHNWVTESSAVLAEYWTGACADCWRDRYHWSPSVVKRGLSCQTARSPDEIYTGTWFLLHLARFYPTWRTNGFRDLYAEQGSGLFVNQCEDAILSSIPTTYDGLRNYFADAVHLYLLDELNPQLIGWFGMPEIPNNDISSPQAVSVGQAFKYQHAGDENYGCLYVQGGEEVNSDTLFVGHAGSSSVATNFKLDAFGSQRIIIGLRPFGQPAHEWTFSSSSVEGHDIGEVPNLIVKLVPLPGSGSASTTLVRYPTATQCLDF